MPTVSYQVSGGPINQATQLTASTPGQTPGRNILLSCSVAGQVTLALSGGSTVTVFPQAGAAASTLDNIYPFSVTNFVVVSGTIVSAFNLS